MGRYLIAIVGLSLLAFVACSDDGDDKLLATDTPALEATSTVVIDPTQPPATATVTRATSTPRPDVEGPCPIDDPALCNFAEALERSMSLGQLDAIVGNTTFASQTCSGLEQVGPCFGLDEAFVLEGYRVGIDASDGIFYFDAESYLQTLEAIADASANNVDGFGGGAWKLVAIVDEGPDMKVLVTTSFDNDPIAFEPVFDRRVFLFRLERIDEAWQISILLTSVFRDFYLIGLNDDGSPAENWLPWGE